LSLIDSQSINANAKTFETMARGEAQFMFSLSDGFLPDNVKIFSRKAKKSLDEEAFVKAAFNKNTNDTASLKQYNSFKKVLDYVADRNNKLGGVSYRDDYGLPYKYNWEKIQKNMGGFKTFVMDAVNWDDAIDAYGKSIPAGKRADVLENVIKNIGSELNIDGVTPGLARLQRKLPLKDAESYLHFTNTYGDSMLSSVAGYIHRSSEILAKMEVFGPDINSGINHIKKILKKDTPLDTSKTAKKLQKKTRDFENLTKEINKGDYIRPTKAGLLIGQSRSFLNAAVMGKSLITNIPLDNAKALHYAGIHKTNFAKSAGGYFKLMSQLPAEEFKGVLKQLGYLSDNVARSLQGYQRNLGYFSDSKLYGNMTNRVYQATGLPVHTNYLRASYGAEINQSITRRIGKDFKSADASFDGRLSKFGFTEADWKIIQKADMTEIREGKFILPEDLSKVEGGQDVARKLATYSEATLQDVVAESSLKARDLFSGGKEGTAPGEVARTLASFKNTPLTIMFSTMQNFNRKGGMFDMKAYPFILQGAIYATFAGWLSKQAKEMLRTGEPFRIDDTELWAQSLMEYNDFSVITEAIYRSSSYGNGLFDNPTFDFAENLIKVGSSGVKSVVDKDAKFDKIGLVNLANSANPANNHFLTGAMYGKYFVEPLKAMIDPKKADKNKRSREKKLKKRK